MSVKTKSTEGGYGWVILIITFLAGFAAPMNMAKVTSLAPVIMGVFGFDPGTLGWVIALFYVMGFVMAFPTTGLINKIGIRNVVVLSLVFAVVGDCMGAMTNSVAVFMASRVLEGAGMGVMGVAGASAIAPWFPEERRSLPLGIWAMWVALAMCVCPILFGWVVDTLGMAWQTAWWISLAYDVVIAVVFWVLYREPKNPNMTEGSEARGKAVFSRAYKSKQLWALALIFFFDEAAFMAINGFLTTYLTDPAGCGTTLIMATAIASAFGVAGAVCAPLSGAIAQLVKGHKWILLFSLLVGVVYTAIVFNLHVVELYWGVMVLAGIVGGFVPSCIWQATPASVEPDDVPAANGLVAFTQNLGMFVGATVMGSAVTAFGWGMGSWVALVPCYILCLIVFFVGLRKMK